jgi:hypothetical protein
MARICAPLPLSLRKTNMARLIARRPFSRSLARVPFGGTVLATVAGELPRGPQCMRITQLLRLPARQLCQPGFRFQRDRRLAERPFCASSGLSLCDPQDEKHYRSDSGTMIDCFAANSTRRDKVPAASGIPSRARFSSSANPRSPGRWTSPFSCAGGRPLMSSAN